MIYEQQFGVWVEVIDRDGQARSEWLRVQFEPKFYRDKEQADALAVSWINDWSIEPGQTVRMTTCTLGAQGLPDRRMASRTRKQGETWDWSPKETDDYSSRSHRLLRS